MMFTDVPTLLDHLANLVLDYLSEAANKICYISLLGLRLQGSRDEISIH